MANKLFDADCGWDNSKICTLPNLPNLKNKRYKNSDGMHQTNKKTFSTIHRDVTSAVLEYTGYNGSLGNTLYGAGHYAIVQVADDMYAAERELADGTREVVSYNKNGELKAAVISPTGRYSSFPGLGSKKEEVDVTTIFLAILPALAEIDEEVCERLNRITSGTGSGECDYYYLSDAMYQHISRVLALQGIIYHECAHIKYLDFKHENEIMKKLQDDGKLYGALIASDAIEEQYIDEINGALTKPEYRPVFDEVYHSIIPQNIQNQPKESPGNQTPQLQLDDEDAEDEISGIVNQTVRQIADEQAEQQQNQQLQNAADAVIKTVNMNSTHPKRKCREMLQRLQ